MKTVLLALALLGASALTLTGSGPRRPPSFSVNWARVLARHDLPVTLEPSTRLAVPAALTEDIWSYLRARRPNGYGERVRQMTDWSYDTLAGRLAEQWVSVRLRTGDSEPRLHVKAYDRSNGHAVELNLVADDSQPLSLLSLVHRDDDRAMLVESLRILGVDVQDLAAGTPVYHARREFVLPRDPTAMSVSLDHLTWDGGEHHVLELTPLPDQSNHEGMAALANELCAVFPEVRLDPRPKLIAVRERTVARDDTVCVWSAARFMCRPAPAPERPPVPSFLPPVPQAMPAVQAPYSSGVGGFAAPLGTGLRGGGIGRLGTGGVQLGTPVY